MYSFWIWNQIQRCKKKYTVTAHWQLKKAKENICNKLDAAKVKKKKKKNNAVIGRMRKKKEGVILF